MRFLKTLHPAGSDVRVCCDSSRSEGCFKFWTTFESCEYHRSGVEGEGRVRGIVDGYDIRPLVHVR